MRPGEVRAWVPTAASRAALESCPVDPRPLTHDQLGHLSGAVGRTQGDPAEAPWIGASCVLADAGPGSVAAALASLFDRHESLRCDYVPGQVGLPSGVPGQDEPFRRRLLPPLVVEFEEVPLGVHDDASAVHAVIMDWFAAHAGPAAWPHSAFVTLESGDEVTLFAAFDHVTFDGFSMYTFAAEIPLLHRVFAAGDAPDPALALSGSHLEHARDEREFTRSLTVQEPRLRPWRELLDDRGRVPGLPSASGVRRGDQVPHAMVSLPVSAAEESEAFRALCESWGVSYGLGFIALLLRAIAVQEGPAPTTVRTMMSTHGRSRPYRGSMGWFAGVAPLTVDVDPSADLRDSVMAVRSAWTDSAPSGRIPLGVVGDLLGTRVEPGLVVSFMDSRYCPGWSEWASTQARGYLGHVPPSDQAHAWINCLPTGTFLEARHPDTRECASWVSTLAVLMRSSLQRALRGSRVPRSELVPTVPSPRQESAHHADDSSR